MSAYKTSCENCHGPVPANKPVWTGKNKTIDVFDQSGDGYTARGGSKQMLTLPEFIGMYMPKEDNPVGETKGNQIAAYMTETAGNGWCPGEDWPPESDMGSSGGNSSSSSSSSSGGSKPGDRMNIVVFTDQDREDHHHDNIGQGTRMFKRLAEEYDFDVDIIYLNSKLENADLSPYDVLVFSGTFGNPLSGKSMQVIEEYIRNGGSYMGTHIALKTQNNWKFMWDNLMLLPGGKHNGHPKGNANGSIKSSISPKDSHPITKCLTDNVMTQTFYMGYNPSLITQQGGTVFMTVDGVIGNNRPVVWGKDLEWGGRTVFTHFGRVFNEKTANRSEWEPAHMYGAVRWAAGYDDTDFHCVRDFVYDGLGDPDYVKGK